MKINGLVRGVALSALALTYPHVTHAQTKMSAMTAKKPTPKPKATPKPKMVAKNLVQTAAANPQFSTLVKALTAAGLAPTLSTGKGSYTIFAPTDAAFAKLPKGTLEKLLQPASKPTLIKILTYHAISKRVTASAILKKPVTNNVRTVEGELVTVVHKGGKVTLQPPGGAKSLVTKTDIIASNGVIHVIDTVLIPPSVMKAMK